MQSRWDAVLDVWVHVMKLVQELVQEHAAMSVHVYVTGASIVVQEHARGIAPLQAECNCGVTKIEMYSVLICINYKMIHLTF